MYKRSRSEKAGAPAAKKPKLTTQALLYHFDLKINCMFCGKTCIADEKQPEGGKDVHRG